MSLVGMFMLCCSLAGAQSNRFTSNLELELVFHDPYMEKEFLIKEGGAVFETLTIQLILVKRLGMHHLTFTSLSSSRSLSHGLSSFGLILVG